MRLGCALAAVALAGCGAIEDLGLAPGVLATVRAELSPTLLEAVRSSTTPVRLGLLWAGTPVYVPYCVEHGPNPFAPFREVGEVARAACRDPLLLVPGEVGKTIPIDGATASIELPLTALPPPSVLVGELGARVGYASLVVFRDKNASDDLEITRSCGGGGGGGPRPGARRDQLLASSFVSLDREQTRLAYLEGDFDRDSLFYPSKACRVLPSPGFSVWTVGPYFGADDSCARRDLSGPIVLEPGDPTELRTLACRASPRDSFPRSPPERAPRPDQLSHCTDAETLIVSDPECECPTIRTYTLKGCSDSLECDNPDWDVRDRPPEWWPCR